jgi:hypothetical protein
MIVRVAVVPHPPILVPEVAADAAGETAPLRDACLVALRALAQRCPRWAAVAAVDPPTVTGAVGSFVGYGVDVQVTLDPQVLPAPAWRGELLYSAAPYGVAYHVALWDAVDPDPQL